MATKRRVTVGALLNVAVVVSLILVGLASGLIVLGVELGDGVSGLTLLPTLVVLGAIAHNTGHGRTR